MPKRILVVDDELDLCKVIAFRLRKEGYDVTVVNDGLEGLNAIRKSSPDLIVLDLMLPSMSGEEVCKTLREDDDREDIQNIPIVMLTAKSGVVDKIVGKVIGANAYLMKPFDVSQLLEEIKRLI